MKITSESGRWDVGQQSGGITYNILGLPWDSGV
jgi:hypothetical protein